jgi:hypothetical protein
MVPARQTTTTSQEMIKNRINKTIATRLGAATLIGGKPALAAPPKLKACASGMPVATAVATATSTTRPMAAI